MRKGTICTHCHISFSWKPTILVDHNLATGETRELPFCNEVQARRYVERCRVDMDLAIEQACDLMDRMILAVLANSWEKPYLINQYLMSLRDVSKFSNYSVAP